MMKVRGKGFVLAAALAFASNGLAAYKYGEYVRLVDGATLSTGVTITDTMELRFKFMIEQYVQYAAAFKEYVNEQSDSTRIICATDKSFYAYFRNKASSPAATLSVGTIAGTVFEGWFNRKKASLNGTEWSLSRQFGTANTSGLVFCSRADKSPVEASRIYSFQIFDNGKMIHWYLPYASEDGSVVGLRDIFTGKNLTNEGGVGSVEVVGEVEIDPNDYMSAPFSYNPETGKVEGRARVRILCEENGRIRVGNGEWTDSQVYEGAFDGSVQVACQPEVSYMLDHWELNGRDVGSTLTKFLDPSLAEPTEAELKAVIRIAPNSYFVDAEKGDDRYNGESPTVDGGDVGPKKTFEAGVALLTANDAQLSVAPGEYFVESLASVNKTRVKIGGRSADVDRTILNGQHKTGILYCGGSGATVCNLTFTNGYNKSSDKYYAGGLSLASSSHIASNCVFACCSNDGNIYGGALYLRGESRAMGCRFIGNVAKSQSGATYSDRSGLTDIGWFSDCVFEGNSVTNGAGGGAAGDKNHYLHFSGCAFTNNYASGNGGAVCARIVGITNCTFVGNSASSAGAFVPNSYQDPMEIADCKFLDNVARSGVGGAIQTYGSDGMAIRRCLFERNRAGHNTYVTTYTGSGAIHCSAMPEIIEDCVFRWNAATNLGISASNGSSTGGSSGAINGPVGTLKNCLFESNIAHYAGAAWANTSETTRRTSEFGGFRMYPARTVHYDRLVTNCIFRGNICGGKINRAGTDRFSAAVTLSSHVSGASSWLMYSGPKDYTFVDCTFDSNRLEVPEKTWGCIRYGAALWASAGVRLDRCVFTNNFCNGSGGAMYGYSTNGITRCTFVDNVSSNADCSQGYDGICGGAIALVGSETNAWNVISNCTFRGNKVLGSCGAAIAIPQSYLRLTDCTFENNTHKTNFTFMTPRGGAVAFEPRCARRGYYQYNDATYGRQKSPGYAMKCAIDRCVFKDNTTTGEGGALTFPIDFAAPGVVPGVEGYVRNCLFTGNKAFFARNFADVTATAQKGAGGAVSVATGLAVSFENCTFDANEAAWQGGALYCNSALGAVTNCVFYGNSDASSGVATDNLKVVDAAQVLYTFAPTGGPLTDGVNGNIVRDENPFRSDDHTDYALRKDCGSAAGLPLDWMADDSLDLGGKPRLAKDGTVDMGCYQRWFKPGLLLFVQ